ncbi:MAG: Acetyltransferase domain [Candidatus Parcubacteria bacterium]|jgi:L-amino acid N-acyltransferase YncA
MIVRDFQKGDKKAVEQIFALYWTDPEFLKNLSRKLDMCVDQTEEYINKQYRFFVAEEHGDIVGISGLRKAPSYLRRYARTDNPAEFYILASKYRHKGIGTILRLKRIEEARKLGFTEVVCYSPNSHKDSWGFHDQLGFERVGEVIAPDGYPGQVWRLLL